MVFFMANNSSDTNRLHQDVVQGDQDTWNRLLSQHRNRLRRMVALRLDQRLQGRIDPSDVIQEAYLEAWTRLGEYLQQPDMPFFLWLRLLTGQKLVTLHRRHLGVHMRDAGREISLYQGTLPETSAAALAAQLLGHHTGPSEAAIRAELKTRLQEAINSMDPLDREILALRHFEQLSRAETVALLGIPEATASKRYLRALKRLKEVLQSMGIREVGP